VYYTAGQEVDHPHGAALCEAGRAEPAAAPVPDEPILLKDAPEITDAARELAEDNGLNWLDVEGTGKNDKITVKDVRALL